MRGLNDDEICNFIELTKDKVKFYKFKMWDAYIYRLKIGLLEFRHKIYRVYAI